MALGMPQTQREQGMILIAFLGFAAAGAYWYFAYAPKSAELATKSAYVDTLEERNSLEKVRSAGSTSEMKAQIEEYGANLQLMRQLIPTSNEVPALIDQVSTAARRAGLDIGKVEPLGVETSTQFHFDALRYKFTVTGPYHDVAEFLTNVGSLPRIMVPLNIQMQAGAQPGPRPDPKKAVTTVFELHTYVSRAAQ
jgi:type IV pilus assembly protein PilO